MCDGEAYSMEELFLVFYMKEGHKVLKHSNISKLKINFTASIVGARFFLLFIALKR
jgi:hypothetical protein